VLDPTDFGGARCPSEQTALGLYRAARLRGGAFWDGVAGLVAGWVAERVRAESPVHDLLGQGETHARFVADVLRPDPFLARLAELAAEGPASAPVAAPEPGDAAGASPTMDAAAGQTRERA
jgi:hypothetical protein